MIPYNKGLDLFPPSLATVNVTVSLLLLSVNAPARHVARAIQIAPLRYKSTTDPDFILVCSSWVGEEGG